MTTDGVMKVLLAIDDSSWSRSAADAVMTQMRPGDIEVRVLHAVEWPIGGPPYLTFAVGPAAIDGVFALRQKALDAGKSLVEEVAARLRAAGFAATGMVTEDDARSVIVDAAAAWKADLIVMGSHGRRGLDRFAMGSVAESVMRRARCSVQIVRLPAQEDTKVA
jgi:nucleotide-binding universal stress UspA family protein